jgi:hypothetical protein
MKKPAKIASLVLINCKTCQPILGRLINKVEHFWSVFSIDAQV